MERIAKKMMSIFRTAIFHIRCRGNVASNGLLDIALDTELRLSAGGKIYIDGPVTIKRNCMLAAYHGQIRLGKGVGINRGCIIACQEKVEIGDDCALGPNVVIFDHDHQFDKNGYKKNSFRTAPVIIGKECWIGANVNILKGTHIGEGSIIGAGTTVVGNIPAYSLVTSDRSLIVQKLIEKE